jgi:anti-sigma28 factor (negative regulator of flagellin synthesis)
LIKTLDNFNIDLIKGGAYMKIYNNVNKVISLYKDNTSIEKTSGSLNSVKKDEIQISKAVKDMSRYIDSTLNTETTNEKVDEIRQKVMNNEYTVNSRELAKAILGEMSGSGDK